MASRFTPRLRSNMPLLLETFDQRSEQWHAARRGRITASVAAACLGLHPHTGPLTAYKQIKGLSRFEGNNYTDWGNRYEPEARNAYECMTGNLVSETGLWVHPKYDFLAASPDGLIGDDGCLEIKCGRLPDDYPYVPLAHRIQMLVQLACTERQWCDYFVYAHQPDGSIRTQYNRVKPSGLPGLIKKLEAFYQTYIVPGVEPPKRTRKKK